MIQKVTLPKLGETVEAATIDKWLKQEGDAVKVGDILCEITTDKATLEVESYHAGTLLKIIAPTGQELPVGTLIAVMGAPGEAIPADLLAGGAPAAASASAKADRAAPASAVTAVAMAPAGRVFASPRARRSAREAGVVLSSLRGTGPGGRIVEADVRAAARAAPAVKASPLARKVAASAGVDLATLQGTGHAGKIMRDDVLAAAQAAPAAETPVAPVIYPAAGHGVPGEVVPLTPMRRIVAERMLESKRSIPCYYLEMDADVTDLVCLRNKLNAKGGQKITFNDFVLKACGLALRAFPIVNSRWVPAGIERRTECSVGFAVALDDGLIVPVVRQVDRKPLPQISAESAGLTERARSKKLGPDEYQGGSMTVSNLGMWGIRSFVPVTNPGESCILGLGMVADHVVFRQGGIQVRKIMAMTLSLDHRLVDGAVGAQFLETIRDWLEAPAKLVE
jgi:pyruvate dehydrogenase E2 component (dihydrolipoamide acetyltransferase)